MGYPLGHPPWLYFHLWKTLHCSSGFPPVSIICAALASAITWRSSKGIAAGLVTDNPFVHVTMCEKDIELLLISCLTVLKSLGLFFNYQ